MSKDKIIKKASEEQIVEALKGVHDPEIPVNVFDLGLIYGIEVKEDGLVKIEMTLTNPNCPVADQMPAMVSRAVQQVAGVKKAQVELVFDPPWTKDRMSEAAMLELGLF